MTITVEYEVELTEGQVDALLAWQDNPYKAFGTVPRLFSQTDRSLWTLRLIEAEDYPGADGCYLITPLGEKVRAKLQEGLARTKDGGTED